VEKFRAVLLEPIRRAAAVTLTEPMFDREQATYQAPSGSNTSGLDGIARCIAAGEGWPNRSVPLREWEKVQALPRRTAACRFPASRFVVEIGAAQEFTGAGA
jgi:hypothetical protein